MRYLFFICTLPFYSLVQADDLRDTYNELNNLNEKGYFVQAFPHARKAARLAEKKFGKVDQQAAVCLGNLGQLYVKRGKLDSNLNLPNSFF